MRRKELIYDDFQRKNPLFSMNYTKIFQCFKGENAKLFTSEPLSNTPNPGPAYIRFQTKKTK